MTAPFPRQAYHKFIAAGGFFLWEGRRYFAQPLWLNTNIDGKRILVYAEHGLGDTIQFSRYLDLFGDKNCELIFEVDAPLVSLFQSQHPEWEVVSRQDPSPQFDVFSPLMNLPLICRTDLNSIPANIPYIVASEHKARKWAERLGPKTKARIGLAWSGNGYFTNGNDLNRPIPLAELAPILCDDFEWYRLQTALKEADGETLKTLPQIKDYTDEFEDFSDTAGLVEQLDLVISIDTSVAHLAGAMGKPVWVLVSFECDTRWFRDRTDNPWYPTAWLFRQHRYRDWSKVVAQISEALL